MAVEQRQQFGLALCGGRGERNDAKEEDATDDGNATTVAIAEPPEDRPEY